jgi:hypothetical protein
MTMEAGMEFARSRWGDTKKLNAEQIQQLDQSELERRLAAQTILSAEQRQGTEQQPLNSTMQELQQEYERRQAAAVAAQISQEFQAGRSWDLIAESALGDSLKGQIEFHDLLASRRDHDRKFKLRKLAASVGAGAVVGALIGESGAEKAQALASQSPAPAGEFVSAPAESTNWDVDVPAAAEATAENQVTQPADMATAAREEMDRFVSAPAESTHYDVSPTNVPEQTADVTVENAPLAVPDAAVDMAKQSSIEVVKKGDTIWDLAERELHDRMGTSFDQLDEARKTYMIDSLKDKIAANPQAFGLENADRLEIGDKVDMTSLFEGREAVPLDGLRAEALALDQQAVEGILKNNELLRDWVTTHPHDALTSTVAEKVMSGEIPVAEAGASVVQPDLADPVQQRMVQRVYDTMTERMLCELQEKYPAEYAQAHAENPELYPDRAGLIESAEPATMDLSDAGIKAVKRYGETVAALRETTSPAAAEKIVSHVGELKVSQAMQKGVIEKMVDGMEGGSAKTAQGMERTVRSIIRALPKGEYLNSEKVADVMKRLPKS